MAAYQSLIDLVGDGVDVQRRWWCGWRRRRNRRRRRDLRAFAREISALAAARAVRRCRNHLDAPERWVWDDLSRQIGWSRRLGIIHSKWPEGRLFLRGEICVPCQIAKPRGPASKFYARWPPCYPLLPSPILNEPWLARDLEIRPELLAAARMRRLEPRTVVPQAGLPFGDPWKVPSGTPSPSSKEPLTSRRLVWRSRMQVGEDPF